VVEALKRLAIAVAHRDGVGAVAAHVDEATERAAGVADDDDRDVCDLANAVVTGASELAQGTRELPRVAEDMVELEVVDRGV
jgi:hypothetical protein